MFVVEESVSRVRRRGNSSQSREKEKSGLAFWGVLRAKKQGIHPKIKKIKIWLKKVQRAINRLSASVD